MSEYSSCSSVKLSSVGSSRIIEMNRPYSLNTLNLEMVACMTEAIKSWESSDSCKVIIITGAPKDGKPVFCAGGDVVSMAKARGNLEQQAGFLAKEYALNHLIATCKKPVVSFLDGVTMGGGAGVSIHGTFRVATENTLFAMPETAIGFIPDVGGTFFISRLGPLGTYLGLTGARLKGQDVYHARLATHYIASDRLNDVKSSLSAGELGEESIDSLLEAFSGEYKQFTLTALLPHIEDCFSRYEIVEILDALRVKCENPDGIVSSWALETLGVLEQKSSPTSLFITLELLKKAKRSSLMNCLRTEYAICRQFLEGRFEDFYEGVRAKLIEKSNSPIWSPASIQKVIKSDIDRAIRVASDSHSRNDVLFLSDIDVTEYSSNHVLPSCDEIRRALDSKLLGSLYRRYNSKMGLAQLIETSLKRELHQQVVGLQDGLDLLEVEVGFEHRDDCAVADVAVADVAVAVAVAAVGFADSVDSADSADFAAVVVVAAADSVDSAVVADSGFAAGSDFAAVDSADVVVDFDSDQCLPLHHLWPVQVRLQDRG